MEPTRIKVCCISSAEEAALALRHGATALGLVSAMPSGPGVIDETLIAGIVRTLPVSVPTFLLTSLRDADAIVAQHQRLRTSTIQCVDRLPSSTLLALRQRLPGVTIVQVIHVVGPQSLDDALDAAMAADALLLDSGNPSAAVKELGGTGRTHDWEVSRSIVQHAPVPVYLAGGLKPGNVEDAIRSVRPYGVDVCSGVRRNGRLDEDLLRAFVAAVRSTDGDRSNS